MQIPGVRLACCRGDYPEIGADMSVFLSVYHMSPWADVCPGSH
jgi:hypothetical protein